LSYLIDTNVLSELRKKDRCDRHVRSWFEQTAEDEIYLSVLTIGELRRGIESVQRRDKAQAAALNTWLLALAETFGQKILSVDTAVAEEWGRMNVPNPLPVIDGLLAATAKVHNLTLVTRNTRDIDRTGVRCLNPFGIQG